MWHKRKLNWTLTYKLTKQSTVNYIESLNLYLFWNISKMFLHSQNVNGSSLSSWVMVTPWWSAVKIIEFLVCPHSGTISWEKIIANSYPHLQPVSANNRSVLQTINQWVSRAVPLHYSATLLHTLLSGSHRLSLGKSDRASGCPLFY